MHPCSGLLVIMFRKSLETLTIMSTKVEPGQVYSDLLVV